MSTLKVNSIVTQDVESSLALQTNNTTQFEITSAGLVNKAPAGMVLQYKWDVLASVFTSTGTSFSDTGLEIVMTPLHASSTLAVEFHGYWDKPGSNEGSVTASLFYDSTESAGVMQAAHDWDTTGYGYPSLKVHFTFGNITERTFKIKGKVSSGAGMKMYGNATLSVMEIAG